MGHTIAEKILARTAGLASVRPGDEILVRPDFILAYDFPGSSDIMLKHVTEDFGVRQVVFPERFGFFIDHLVSTPTPAEQAFHAATRAWCAANSVQLFEQGIGHQVAAEVGFATPGALVLHHDPHIAQLGIYGTLAIGLRRNLLEAFVRERVSITVPHTVRINLTGNLQSGVMARDIFHHIVRVIGPSGCRNSVLEIGGSAIAELSTDGLQTIAALSMFLGALTAVVNPDQRILDHALPRARIRLTPVFSDADAMYLALYEIDVSGLDPIIVIPPNPSNTRNLNDYVGLEVHSGYVGSCAAGRLEDIRAVARVLSGRKVRPNFPLYVVPSSQAIMDEARREGLLELIARAGGIVPPSSCDYCFGRMGAISAAQRAVSTGTLNVPGRMGSPDSEIYILNAAAVAAAAIEGCIADPRKYL